MASAGSQQRSPSGRPSKWRSEISWEASRKAPVEARGEEFVVDVEVLPARLYFLTLLRQDKLLSDSCFHRRLPATTFLSWDFRARSELERDFSFLFKNKGGSPGAPRRDPFQSEPAAGKKEAALVDVAAGSAAGWSISCTDWKRFVLTSQFTLKSV